MPATLEHWAARKPDAIAIVDGDRRYSWRAVDDAANRLARGLARRGIAAGDVVAVRTQIRAEWAIIAAALAKLDASLVGVNWRLTPSEVKYVLEDSGARGFLCDDQNPALFAGIVSQLGIKVCVSLDAVALGFESLASVMSEAGEPIYSEGDANLIVYTSGTTGQPKGVAMGQSRKQADPRVLEYVRDVQSGSRVYQEDDVILVSMPMHHGSGPGQVRTGLRIGAQLVLQRRFDPEATLALMQEFAVTRWTGVPTMYKRLAALPPAVLARYDLPSLRAITVGAAPVTSTLKAWIVAQFGNILGESYGSTEMGIVSSLAADMQLAKPGSSGLPHKHVDIQVRDAQGNLLAPGEVGELWIKTPVVIRQYLNRPALGPDVLDANGYFASGDMGRVDEEGYLYITDRSKDMIISGGVNIYPAEIEAVLLEHPAILDAAVVGVPDAEFGESVKAFCELKPGACASGDELLLYCSRDLASYKRPKSIDIVDELPRNAMGKLLKRELREPFWKNQERNV